ncbi:MAG: hypothetical protein M3Q05_13510 [Bacteroidota bacterium]|nr:hypothetical protein [Bacteroidota bacterium]
MNHELVKDILCELGEAVCQKVHQSLQQSSVEALSAVYKEGEDDTIYQIDRDVEEILIPRLSAIASQIGGIVLIMEGVSEMVLPIGMPLEQAQIRLISILLMVPGALCTISGRLFFWPVPLLIKVRKLVCRI